MQMDKRVCTCGRAKPRLIQKCLEFRMHMGTRESGRPVLGSRADLPWLESLSYASHVRSSRNQKAVINDARDISSFRTVKIHRREISTAKIVRPGHCLAPSGQTFWSRPSILFLIVLDVSWFLYSFGAIAFQSLLFIPSFLGSYALN